MRYNTIIIQTEDNSFIEMLIIYAFFIKNLWVGRSVEK